MTIPLRQRLYNRHMKSKSLLLLVLALMIVLTACGENSPEISVETAHPVLETALPIAANSPEPQKSDVPATATQYVNPIPTEQTIEAEEHTEPETPILRNLDGMTLIPIVEGKVWIGCDESNNAGFDCWADELPLHQVWVDAFWMDKFEVSNAQFARCVKAGACQTPYYLRSATREEYYPNPDFADYPRVAVSWFEAEAYCNWVGGRLPTEAEWVRAARGEDKRVYPWGDQPPTCELANSLEVKTGLMCVGDTARVGSYPLGASPFGVMDLAGNVWEWTADWYHGGYYSFSPEENPQGPEQGGTKVVHGGGFDYSLDRLRIAYTSDHDPREHKIGFGFRCVMDRVEGE